MTGTSDIGGAGRFLMQSGLLMESVSLRIGCVVRGFGVGLEFDHDA